MNKKINFSINICCLNSEKFLNETIQSVINQSYQNWELILVDNGSDDNVMNLMTITRLNCHAYVPLSMRAELIAPPYLLTA